MKRSNGGQVVEVDVEIISACRKVDRRVFAGDLEQVLGLITNERGQFSHSAKPAAGIQAGDPRFRLQSVRTNRTTLRQAQEFATRHDMEE